MPSEKNSIKKSKRPAAAVAVLMTIDALQILTAGAANRMICPIILEAIRRLVELGLKVTK